jgi:hypothetical protein
MNMSEYLLTDTTVQSVTELTHRLVDLEVENVQLKATVKSQEKYIADLERIIKAPVPTPY